MDHREQTILDLQSKLRSVEAEAEKIKTTINYLCELSGQPPMYALTGESQSMVLRGDEYHARPLATVVTDVLNRRKEMGMGPAETAEIYDDLLRGGFEFESKTEAIAKRNLSISLSKNPKFYRLPNQKWGLLEWYPNAKQDKPAPGNVAREKTEAPEDASGDDSKVQVKEVKRATDAA